MLYYIRMLTIWFKSIYTYERKAQNIFTQNTLSIRAMPSECNLFMVMDNSKYNRAIDLSKFYILIHYKKFGEILKKQWKPLTVSLELNLLRPIGVFQKYQVSSKVTCWENGFIFMEHNFYSKNKLIATALSKACFVSGKKKVLDDELNTLYGMSSPPMPEVITRWNELKHLQLKCYEN